MCPEQSLTNSYLRAVPDEAFRINTCLHPNCVHRFPVIRWDKRQRRYKKVNILLATDGSEYSDAATRFLTRLKLSPEDKITILYIVSEVPYEDEYHAQILRVIKRVAPKILSSASDILKDVKAKVSVEEKEGYPDSTIVESAAASDADLVVMGARGVRGLKLLILGSVTRAVVNNSPKPVLVVKRTEWDTPRTMNILFATDGSESAVATAKLLAALPFYDDFRITVLNVQHSAFYDIPDRFAIEIEDRTKEAAAERRKQEFAESEKILEDAKKYLSGKYKHLQFISKFGDPASEILSTAEQMRADTIAIGCRGLRGIKGMLGSVSRNVVTRSKSSVLIGKAP